MMTLIFLSLAVLMFFISEVFGDTYPVIQNRFRVAGSFTLVLMVIWIIASLSAGEQFLPDFQWPKIIIEKCGAAC